MAAVCCTWVNRGNCTRVRSKQAINYITGLANQSNWRSAAIARWSEGYLSEGSRFGPISSSYVEATIPEIIKIIFKRHNCKYAIEWRNLHQIDPKLIMLWILLVAWSLSRSERRHCWYLYWYAEPPLPVWRRAIVVLESSRKVSSLVLERASRKCNQCSAWQHSLPLLSCAPSTSCTPRRRNQSIRHHRWAPIAVPKDALW